MIVLQLENGRSQQKDLACGRQAFIATLLFDPSMLARYWLLDIGNGGESVPAFTGWLGECVHDYSIVCLFEGLVAELLQLFTQVRLEI